MSKGMTTDLVGKTRAQASCESAAFSHENPLEAPFISEKDGPVGRTPAWYPDQVAVSASTATLHMCHLGHFTSLTSWGCQS